MKSCLFEFSTSATSLKENDNKILKIVCDVPLKPRIYYFAQNRRKIETRCHSFSSVLTNVSWIMKFLTCRYKICFILHIKKLMGVKEIAVFCELT